MNTDQQPPPARPALRWAVWSLALAVWTVSLLSTQPVRVQKELVEKKLASKPAIFSLAKTLHVCAYAALAAAIAWLPGRPRWRWLCVGLLLLHGAITEYLQTFVEGRTGSVRDVGLDWLGIGLGLAVSWRRWRPRA